MNASGSWSSWPTARISSAMNRAGCKTRAPARSPCPLPLQFGNITSDAVFNYFDNLLPDSPLVRDRIVKRYQARSKQPFDLLAEVGRDSVGAVTLLPRAPLRPPGP
ncbi:Serine/threonine-protein kinase HipA [Raoultella terrigena]|uniref:Serine/threonine-protein kinase HipA n=1 Tax=Raoultella terrigena TaxID=577 RepID=A0A3P8JKJ8_RAOTE|nr:Serine/threonine-protein kinase HipA [Raoultella terrigena]